MSKSWTIWWLLLPLSFIALVSCAVKPPDFEVCKKLPSKKGYCFRVMSGKARYIDPLQFEKLIFKGVVISPEEYAPLKKFILKMCYRDQVCAERDYMLRQQLSVFEKRSGIHE